MASRKAVAEFTLTGPNITLEDLRWLLQATNGYSGSSKVIIKRGYDDQRDSTPDEIVIQAEPKDPVVVTNTTHPIHPAHSTFRWNTESRAL